MVDSVRVLDPGWRLTDSSGSLVSGGKLKFYDAGTTTPRVVYSNSALSSSLGSTVYTGSDGVPVASSGSSTEVMIYTGTTAFKVVMTDDSDVEILTFDNILGALDTSTFLTTSSTSTLSLPVVAKTSDYTLVSGDRGKVINANSTGGTITLTLTAATTLGDGWNVVVRHSGTANSVIIQTSQTISYAGTTAATSYTMSVGETVQIVCDAAGFHVFNAISAPTIPQPQGYLTLTSATPILSSDVTAATAVYYTPYTGNIVPIWNGVRFVPVAFTELTLTLSSSNSASSLYDVFIFNDAGTLRLVTGPVWSTSTAGSGARGTGAGTTQLSRVNGIWTNTVAMTGRNGATTYSVGAGYGTYLGSLFIDSTQGQVTCHTSYGQSRKWGVWNAYNRRPIILRMGDATASWTYNAATVRQSRATAGNTLACFTGLPEEWVRTEFSQQVSNPFGASAATAGVSIGLNSTSASSGFVLGNTVNSGGSSVQASPARHFLAPTIGINNLNALEYANTNTVTFTGTETSMLFITTWMG